MLDGISRLRDPRTIPWLIEYADGYPDNRHYAIDMLEELRAKEAIPAIRRWLTDGPDEGREAAERALKVLEGARSA